MRSLTSGRRWTVRSAMVLAAALSLITANAAVGAANGTGAREQTPVQKYGKVRVCGMQLCDQNGEPVQLKGMSTHGTQWYAHCLTDPAMDALAYDWKASVLRVATYAREGGYAANPAKYTQLASDLIDKASERGMYVIVDWHMIYPGDPNLDLDNALAFFKEIAKRHADKPNVLYETANEPNQVGWSTIKAYSEKVIGTIRAEDPDSVILVGNHGWSTLGKAIGSTEQAILDNPINASNLMYTFHYYAAWNKDPYRTYLERASSRVPVFVTEWATPHFKGGPSDFPMAQKFVDMLAKKKISWTSWSLSDNDKSMSVFKQGACKSGQFAGTSGLKPDGVWMRERIRG